MDLHIPEGALCEGRCTLLCTICNRQSEVLSEGPFLSKIRRKLQCGHSRLFTNYSPDIERIRDAAKAAKFRKIDSLISELNQIIRKMEKTGEPNMDSAKELLEELHKPFKAKLPRRKEIGALLKIVRDENFGEVFSAQLDKNDGELDDESVAKLKRLADYCIKNRKSRR